MERERRARRLSLIRRQLEIALPAIDVAHFVRCEVCGQFYDESDFVEVWYHDDGPHAPMKADA